MEQLSDAAGEDHALAFLYLQLEIAGHVEVFVEVVSPFLLLGVFDAAIPVGQEVKLVFLVQLHEQLGITRVHARLDAVRDGLVVAACLRILVSVFTHTAKRQERAQAERRG